MKKSLIVVLALVLVFAFSATALAEAAPIHNINWDVTGTGAAHEGSNYFITMDGSATVTATLTTVGLKFNAWPDTDLLTNTVASWDKALNFGVNTLAIGAGTYTLESTVDPYPVYDPTNFDAESFNVYYGKRVDTLDDVDITRTAGTGEIGAWTFNSGITSYNIHVDSTVTELTFAPTKDDDDSTVVIKKGIDVDIDGIITLNSTGTTVVTIEVTAQNTFDKTTYTFNVSRDWDDTSLTLTIGTTTLTDDSGDFEYFFPYGSIDAGESITFTPNYNTAGEGSYEASPRSADAEAITVTDRETSLKVTFEEDPDSTYRVNITVTAPDGETEEDYVLYLEESEPVLLDDLEIMIGSTTSSKDLDFTMVPATFDDETFTYYVFVPWDDSSAYEDGVNVYFGVEYDTDTIDSVKCYATSTTTLDDGDSPVKVGSVADGEDEEFTITLIDEDDNTQDYKVYVFYGEEDADNDADLDDLYVKYGTSYKTEATLSPDFASNTLNYTASLPLNTKSAKITLKLSDSGASIICNGEKVGSTITVTDLKSGANTFKIVVIAEDYDTTKTYNLTINVGSGGLLTNLVFTPISGSLNVSPSFSGDVYNYVANVANGVSAIYVTPTAIDSSYTISVYKGASDYKTVVSGKTSSAITLNEGLNEIKVYVYKSGSSKTYTLSIYRQPAVTKYQVSSQAITVNGVNKTLYAVNINGNNYLKLRDLAYMLSGTTKQFNVTFSTSTNTAAITSLSAYVNDPSNPVNQPIVLSNPQLSSQLVTLNGKAAYPIAYNVAGSNYVNLRQICAMLDIGLTYSSATNTISITTANSYTPGM